MTANLNNENETKQSRRRAKRPHGPGTGRRHGRPAVGGSPAGSIIRLPRWG